MPLSWRILNLLIEFLLIRSDYINVTNESDKILNIHMISFVSKSEKCAFKVDSLCRCLVCTFI